MDEESQKFFWSKVDMPHRKKCWEWQGAKTKTGYGNVRHNKKYLRAHRVAWELVNFEVPDGYIVCHVCDNPSCCNPDHLMLGTIRSNAADMMFKNRSAYNKKKFFGTDNHNAKLDKEKVKNIRRLYREREYNQYQLADFYNVSQHTISSVIKHETWKDDQDENA